MSFDIPPDLAAGLRAWIADIVRTELKVQRADRRPRRRATPSRASLRDSGKQRARELSPEELANEMIGLSRLDRARRRGNSANTGEQVMDHPGLYSVVHYCPDID